MSYFSFLNELTKIGFKIGKRQPYATLLVVLILATMF